MWDPGNYLDTDFGLEDGESFEPDGAEEWDQVDLSAPHIRTVLGPIPSDALGICLSFEYLAEANPLPLAESELHLPLRDSQIAEELEMFFVSGGRSIVNLTPIRGDQALRRLRAIGRRLPVHIITAIEPALLSEMGGPMALDGSAGLVVLDLADGLPSESQARAIGQSGLPVFLSGGTSALILEALSLLDGTGNNAARTVRFGTDAHFTNEFIADLASSGVMVGFEGVGAGESRFDAVVTDTIVHLIEAGLSNRILISTGLQSPAQFISQGGQPGWTYVLEHFALHLMAAGVPALGIRQMLLENPETALSIVPLPTQSPSESV